MTLAMNRTILTTSIGVLAGVIVGYFAGRNEPKNETQVGADYDKSEAPPISSSSLPANGMPNTRDSKRQSVVRDVRPVDLRMLLGMTRGRPHSSMIQRLTSTVHSLTLEQLRKLAKESHRSLHSGRNEVLAVLLNRWAEVETKRAVGRQTRPDLGTSKKVDRS